MEGLVVMLERTNVNLTVLESMSLKNLAKKATRPVLSKGRRGESARVDRGSVEKKTYKV